MTNHNKVMRKIIKMIAEKTQYELSLIDPDYLPLDGDETVNLSILFRQELDKLNANV